MKTIFAAMAIGMIGLPILIHQQIETAYKAGKAEMVQKLDCPMPEAPRVPRDRASQEWDAPSGQDVLKATEINVPREDVRMRWARDAMLEEA